MKSNKNELHVLILTNVPSPSTNDFFENLENQDNLSIKVLYCSRTTKKWKEGVKPKKNYESHFLLNLNPFSKYATGQINPGSIRHILDSKVDIVQIHGYSYPTALIALLLVKLIKKPFVYWGEMINRTNTNNPIKKAIQKLVIQVLNDSKAAFIVGSKGAKSYINLGLNPALIYKTSYSPDLTEFLSISKLRPVNKGKQITIVTTSQLIPRKRVDLTIKAFISLSKEFRELSLTIIGSGPLFNRLDNLIPVSLKNRVSWLGYLERKKHPAIYKNCDIFVLSSREDGGPVVLPEAMATGLPVITTTGVATATDMIQNGVNGYIVPKDDLYSLEEKIKILVKDKSLRLRMGEKSKENAIHCNAENVAANHVNVLSNILSDSSLL